MCLFFFFNDTATTEIYTLSLHDALPISSRSPRSTRISDSASVIPRRLDRASRCAWLLVSAIYCKSGSLSGAPSRRGRATSISAFFASALSDRKSTRLNSSHQIISYAVFCLKKKKEKLYNLYEHHNALVKRQYAPAYRTGHIARLTLSKNTLITDLLRTTTQQYC